jgi:hypothetical protein
MSTPEQGGSDQYATPQEVEDLEAAADEQEKVAGGSKKDPDLFLKMTEDRSS